MAMHNIPQPEMARNDWAAEEIIEDGGGRLKNNLYFCKATSLLSITGWQRG